MPRPDRLSPRRTPLSHASSVLLVVALALLAACGESPTTPARSPTPDATPLLAAGGGNSLNAKSCQKAGWQGLATSTGAPFASEQACTAYAAKGGVLYQRNAITFAPLAGKTYGDADFTVSATASSALPVTFTSSGNCSVAGATVHLTGAGSCTITAQQAGSATWLAATDVPQTFAIAHGSQTISFAALAGKTFGDADFTVSATSTSGLPVALVPFDGCFVAPGSGLQSPVTVRLLRAGTCGIVAKQSGDANWLPAQDVIQTFTIAKGDQTISFTSTNPSPVTVGGPAYTPAATATSGLSVAFTLDATSTGCSLANGVVSFASAGTCVIDADQPGNNNYNAASPRSQSVTINASRTSTGCAAVNGGVWNGTATGVLSTQFPSVFNFTLGDVIHVSMTVASNSAAGASFTLSDLYPSSLYTLSSGAGPVSATFAGDYTLDNDGLIPDVAGMRPTLRLDSVSGVTATTTVTCTPAP